VHYGGNPQTGLLVMCRFNTSECELGYVRIGVDREYYAIIIP